jgi:hypothetical protein
VWERRGGGEAGEREVVKWNARMRRAENMFENKIKINACEKKKRKTTD